MIIREYTTNDFAQCIEIFDSNCPLFFDPSERELFIHWLNHQAGEGQPYRSPTYSNSVQDKYYVIENEGRTLVACGGFYVVNEPKEARLAWGMVHAQYHKMKYGTALFHNRREQIKKDWPTYLITLGTSQHTYLFYEKMGLKVMAIEKAGYGPSLDKYDMQE